MSDRTDRTHPPGDIDLRMCEFGLCGNGAEWWTWTEFSESRRRNGGEIVTRAGAEWRATCRECAAPQLRELILELLTDFDAHITSFEAKSPRSVDGEDLYRRMCDALGQPADGPIT